jgi:signal transduction histidine kinase
MLFNLSLRYKLPLLGAMLILVTAMALSTSFLFQAWDGVRRDMLKSSEDLGQTMARSLFSALLHDDVWRAFELISLPFKGDSESTLAESLIVLDANRRVFASSHPETHPLLSDLAELGRDFRTLDRDIAMSTGDSTLILEHENATHIFIAIPIVSDSVRLGTLIVAHNTEWIWRRFARLITRAAWMTLLILAVLLPINWYWGGRMVAPLQLVTRRLSHIGSGELAPLDPRLYPYTDEVGSLYQAYGQLVEELKEKVLLKREVINHERMAAVGRLTASIAHEINNPLGGMLNAISTLKRYGPDDPVTQKTVSLLERGLSQIRETVAALLVEAKITSRHLTLHDIDDVRLLVAPGAHKQQAELTWRADLPESLPLPSTPVRQLLINLSLNAIQAAGRGGHVTVRIGGDASKLIIVVENDGQTLSPAQRERLFEPFLRSSEHGNGLGLWICYQIVTQLNGDIRAESADHLTRFIVGLPLDTHSDSDSDNGTDPATHLPD